MMTELSIGEKYQKAREAALAVLKDESVSREDRRKAWQAYQDMAASMVRSINVITQKQQALVTLKDDAGSTSEVVVGTCGCLTNEKHLQYSPERNARFALNSFSLYRVVSIEPVVNA